MRRRRTMGRALAAGALAVATTMAAAAAEIKVLTAGAFKPVVTALAPDFKARTGHVLVVANDTAGALARRIAEGEAFDLVIATPAALDAMAQAGRLAAGAPTPLARVAIGVAVKEGAPLPDIGSVAALRQTLLAARAVALIDPAAGGSSGVYLQRLFERWGIAAQIGAKAVRVPGGLVAQRVVSGEADIALHQISEILAVPGARLVGPIPAEIQNFTVYAGSLAAATREAPAARAFLDLLAGDRARALLTTKGMEPP